MRVQKKKEGPVLTMNGFFLLVLTVLAMGSSPAQAQSDLFTDLKQQYTLNAELYFYASTLRMINIKRDPNFDEMVKGIKKMTLYQLGGADHKEVRTLSRQFQDQASFEELMTLEDKEQLLYVMARDDEYIAFMKTSEGLTAVNLKGSIGVHKIPELINSFQSDNFLNVFEVGKGEREEHQQEKENSIGDSPAN